MVLNPHREAGSVIILLFVLVAIFGALSFALLQSSRSSMGWFNNEKSKAASNAYSDCANAFNMAIKRLEARGCGTRVSFAIDGSNTILGAPSDGSCSIFHSNGGGVHCSEAAYSSLPCSVTNIGGICPDGSIYAGITPDGSKRMYTTPGDAGLMTWNKGGAGAEDTPIITCNSGESSCTTGKANTATLAGLATSFAPYVAASFCDALIAHGKSDWYLPALNELLVIQQNRTAIGGFNLTGNYGTGHYWTSSETTFGNAKRVNFNDGVVFNSNAYIAMQTRCVRHD